MNNSVTPLQAQIVALEKKASDFDIAVAKINELEAYLKDPSPSGKALADAVQRLIDFYKPDPEESPKIKSWKDVPSRGIDD